MGACFPRYETDQLISVVGGKRPLLDPLCLIIAELLPKKGPGLFLDPFCGSGIVSRIARNLGMRVAAGDLEPFSFITNHVYLTLGNEDLSALFPEMGGLDAYLSMINLQGLFASETGQGVGEAYLSKYYAPQSDAACDGERERLFFTAANARFLDAVRNELEQGWLDGRTTATEKAVVLSSILYEASRRANTSGSFTACHKRFATSAGPVRSRITDTCVLRAPVLPERDVPRGEMYSEEASVLVKRYTADICYLDPPATVHQYGSAYHLLNSIAMWDGMAPSGDRDGEGRLVDRAGIRSDWKRTYSPYCSLKHADAAFIHLLGCVDARHIVLSYPASGILKAERIFELLSARRSPVRVVPLPKRNQGGRQGNEAKRNVEQVFITGDTGSVSLMMGDGMAKLPVVERLDALTASVFRHPADAGPFRIIGGVILAGLPPAGELLSLDVETLKRYVGVLEEAACASIGESLEVLTKSLVETPEEMDGAGRARVEKRLFSLLRRLLEDEGPAELIRTAGALRSIVLSRTASRDSAVAFEKRLAAFIRPFTVDHMGQDGV